MPRRREAVIPGQIVGLAGCYYGTVAGLVVGARDGHRAIVLSIKCSMVLAAGVSSGEFFRYQHRKAFVWIGTGTGNCFQTSVVRFGVPGVVEWGIHFPHYFFSSPGRSRAQASPCFRA